MKFELQPNNRGFSDDDLLKELRSTALSLNKNYVTREEYDRTGRLYSSTFTKRFGSLRTALEQAGLGVSCHFHATTTDEQLFENLEHLWESLGRQPKRSDFVKPLSRCSYDTYPRRFETYRKALEAFVATFESPGPDRPDQEAALPEQHGCVRSPPLAATRHRTARNVGWRMRFLVMRRDDFKCRICGRSPALHPGTILVVDHVIPWVDGGETVVDNLQTLCEPCNGGKSDFTLTQG